MVMRFQRGGAAALLSLAAMFGQFGNDTRPQDYTGTELRGSKGRSSKPNPNKKPRNAKRTGHARKTHRRSFLCGRPHARY